MQRKDYVLLLATFLIVLLLGVVAVQFDAIQKAEKFNNINQVVSENIISDKTKGLESDSGDQSTESPEALNGSDEVDIKISEDLKTVEIVKNGSKVAEIVREHESSARILKQINDNIYILA